MLYGYARVSTNMQRLDRQIRNLEEYAADRKIKIFREKFTGTKIERPQFNRLLSTVKEGDTIVFDSVSRMSRDAEEGFDTYMKLYDEGINLVFLKEPTINTEAFRSVLQNTKMSEGIKTNDEDADELINGIMQHVAAYIARLAEKQIQIAFAQAEKEVQDLHVRISEGMKATQRNNELLPDDKKKQIGRVSGRKYETKKAVAMKKKIRQMARALEGNMTDAEVIETLNISRNTYYKYKRELLEEDLQKAEINQAC